MLAVFSKEIHHDWGIYGKVEFSNPGVLVREISTIRHGI
jgi:hypothetical protein